MELSLREPIVENGRRGHEDFFRNCIIHEVFGHTANRMSAYKFTHVYCTYRFSGGVLTAGLNVTFEATGVEAGVRDQITVNATVRFSQVSDDIEGFGLWKLSVYGSKNSDGSGEQFQRFDQMLTNRQQAQSLIGKAKICDVVKQNES